MLALSQAIEALEAMPEFLDTALDIVSGDDLRFRASADTFSLVEHACHLRDLEREGYLVRVRRMIGEKDPALEPFHGSDVARSRDYLAQDAKIAAQEFAAARREVTGLLAPLTEADLAREATFGGERVTFADVIAMMVEHDRGHREEIEELMDAIERQ
jgi:DinB family protein